ncbi:hypothetical protein [Nonomuraea sp. LPB2021202275-12-8]|uniref:hypothetical protein n=1 Tax=Nonomuraea sp. LPB2021202275-12-8 TaxID=3120159 RepID=UPI003FA5C330
MLDVSRTLVHHVARSLRDERRRVGTPKGSRALTPFWQVVLILRWFRGEHDIPKLGRDHRLSRATAYRYVAEGIDVLVAQAPNLHDALNRAQADGLAYVILDGTLIGIDRCAEQIISVKGDPIDAWYAGKIMPVPTESPTSARRRRQARPSAFDTLQGAFDLLVTGPQPLALAGVSLVELKRRLLHPDTTRAFRDDVWRQLVLQARTGEARRGEAKWIVGVAGVALPGLRRTAGRITWGFRGDTADLDAEVLTGFLNALTTIDLDRPGIATRLRWAAHRAGERARQATEGATPCPQTLIDSFAPPAPYVHPDQVLFDAVAKNVLTATEAELIGRTRLEHRTLIRGRPRARARHRAGQEDAPAMRGPATPRHWPRTGHGEFVPSASPNRS